jgi:hypothetical protein
MVFSNFKCTPIDRKKSIRRKKMSVDPKQFDEKTKIIGFRVTEEELQNVIYTVMHDSAIISLVSLTMIP